MEKFICTSCIKNAGLRFLAEKLRDPNDKRFFDTCGHTGGFLNEDNVDQLVHEFFVNGSIPPSLGGNAPVYNIKTIGINELTFESELDHDIELLSQYKPLPLYHYGPPLYKIGATTNYQELVIDGVSGCRRKEIWEEIISACKSVKLEPGSMIFRARKGNSLPPALENEFDSNPNPTEGRFNKSGEKVFYGAFEIETCLHEIRVALTDWIALATFQVKKELRLLDITDITELPSTPFESIDIFIRKIIYSGESEYLLCQELANEIKNRGYDGFTTTSFFKQAHKDDLKNIILFGQPVKDRKISMTSTNKINLNFISYEFSFGPMSDNKGLDMKALRLLAKQYKDKFKLVESGELKFDEFQKFMDYYMHEFMTIMENS
ncbi:RES family NAD+ phosphorylase [Citrobacter sp. CK198]|uniref:RES family NAD+ phosphorylase n=1 Tax=Citrobacter sp. CK198 TaxID=2985107 RepID=UPI0025771833|nr:RES family NAD+ phosphorylase [Citrobacter sp. CK198]MDM2972393.1 RES family NAD+ phosphorylase [Citrobacter sp. CK198]